MGGLIHKKNAAERGICMQSSNMFRNYKAPLPRSFRVNPPNESHYSTLQNKKTMDLT